MAAESRRASNYAFGTVLATAIVSALILIMLIFAINNSPIDQAVVNAASQPVPLALQAHSTPTTNAPTAAITIPQPPSDTVQKLRIITIKPVQPMADVLNVAHSDNPSMLIGKRVTFDNAIVSSVIADRAFWLADPSGARMLAVLDKALDNGTIESGVNVNTGQQRTLSGIVQALPPLDVAQKEWNLSTLDVSDIQGEKVYVQVDTMVLQH